MLSWPKGGHKSDGVWAKYWYGAVHLSEGFSEEEKDLPSLDASTDISRKVYHFIMHLRNINLNFKTKVKFVQIPEAHSHKQIF